MTFELKPWNRGISDEDLLADLRRVAGVLNKLTVKYEEYPKYGRCASRIFEARFGSWNEALTAAGLEVSRRQNIPDLEYFKNMERVWRAHGRQPSRSDMTKPLSTISKGSYERRFGGWRKALEAFVSFINNDQKVLPLEPEDDDSFPDRRSDRRFPDLRLRFRVMSRDSFRCQICGRSPANSSDVRLHVDHILPWSKGGKTREDNLRTLCEQCNLGKGDLGESNT